MDTQNKRQVYLDLLRIAATFSVVLLHVIPLSTLSADVGSAQWRTMSALSILQRWNVPVFFMISGALFLSPRREVTIGKLYRKTIPRMLVSFLFWSAVYALIHCLLSGKGKWTFLNQLLRGHYHMWYILAIVSLYGITPLLRRITESRQATQYLLLTGFLFSFVATRAMSFLQLFDLPHMDVAASASSALAQLNPYSGLCSIYYFVLGHALHADPPKGWLRRFILLFGALGAFLAVALTFWHSALLGTTSSFFFGNTSLCVLAMAAAVFVLFQRLFSGVSLAGKTQRAVLRMAQCAFGVYLIHPMLVERINLPRLSASALLFFVLIEAVAVFALSGLLSSLLSRVPLLRKTVV